MGPGARPAPHTWSEVWEVTLLQAADAGMETTRPEHPSSLQRGLCMTCALSKGRLLSAMTAGPREVVASKCSANMSVLCVLMLGLELL